MLRLTWIRSRANILVILLLGVVFFSLLSPTAEAFISSEDDEGEEDESGDEDYDDDDDWDEDEERHLGEHEVEVEVSNGEAVIHLKRETADYESEIELKFKTEAANLELKFEEEIGNSETERKMEIELQQVIEYNDSNMNGGFDAGETVLSAWDLSDSAHPLNDTAPRTEATWNGLTASEVTNEGISGWHISATANLGGDGATFSIDLYVFGTATSLAGGELNPTDVKIDFGFHNITANSNSSAVALLLEMKTEQECDLYDSEENAEQGCSANFNSTDVSSTLTFGWLEHATVDGTEMAVNHSEIEWSGDSDGSSKTHEKLLLFSYPHGQDIVHDPKLSVQYGKLAGGSTSPPTGPPTDEGGGVSPLTLKTVGILLLITLPLFTLLTTFVLRGGKIVDEENSIPEPLIAWLLPPPPTTMFVQGEDEEVMG